MKLKTSLLSLAVLAYSSSSLADSRFSFSVQSSSEAFDAQQTQVVFVDDIEALDGGAALINERSSGKLAQLMRLNKFEAKLGNTLHLQMLAGVDDVLIVGSAVDQDLTASDLQNLGGTVARELNATINSVAAQIHIDNITSNVQAPSAFIAKGYHLRDYSFDKYLSVKDEGQSDIAFVNADAQNAKSKYEEDLAYVAQGVHLARDLATEPGNGLYPALFAERIKDLFKGVDDVKVRVLDMDELEKLNMGALIGVGKGSINDPLMLVIEYMGGKRGDAPIALAGKGITFDTGGISLKGNDGMWAMKADMSGAAAVAGTLHAIANRKAPVNVVGLMPLAENMPSQDAIRPGDVLETMKGTTIEIMSTDAEGRLILSDAVYYAQQEYAPKMLLNIATLTGSAARALSDEYAALITRDFAFSSEIMAIGERSGENVWPLPLHPNHFEQIKSPIADIKNSGAGNPGASIGAAVIGTFVEEDLPWVHLDIAGVDWLNSEIDVAPAGAQGWGVRFMDELVREYAAKDL